MQKVAIGVILHPEDRTILIDQRLPTAKTFPGLWEIPGGKCEPGEEPEQALTREMQEELGIDVRQSEELLRFFWVHPNVTKYQAYVYLVTDWRGRLQMNASTAMRWVTPAFMAHYPMIDHTPFVILPVVQNWLAANRPSPVSLFT